MTDTERVDNLSRLTRQLSDMRNTLSVFSNLPSNTPININGQSCIISFRGGITDLYHKGIRDLESNIVEMLK